MFTAFIEFGLILQTHCRQESVCTVCNLCTLAFYNNYIQFYKYNYIKFCASECVYMYTYSGKQKNKVALSIHMTVYM